MLLRKDFAGAHPCALNRNAVDDRIGPCKINVLENAALDRLFAAVLTAGNHALFAENKDFARLDVAFKHGAGRTQRAVL